MHCEIRHDDADISVLIDVYDADIWLTEPTTGLRVGIGRTDDGQPFVLINTENAVDPQVDDEPQVCVLLNDATLYDVEPAGSHDSSLYHRVFPTTKRDAT